MNSTDNIKTLLKTSISVKKEILRNEDIIKNLSDVIQSISQAIKKNNFIFFCGNGGSAADAQHIAAEFEERVYKTQLEGP